MVDTSFGGNKVSKNPHYHPKFEERTRDTRDILFKGETQSHLKIAVWLIKTQWFWISGF